MEKLVKIKDKEYQIKEVKYKDMISIATAHKDDASEYTKKIMQLSTGITDEDYDNLSMKDGLELQKAVNTINGLENFQKPLKD